MNNYRATILAFLAGILCCYFVFALVNHSWRLNFRSAPIGRPAMLRGKVDNVNGNSLSVKVIINGQEAAKTVNISGVSLAGRHIVTQADRLGGLYPAFAQERAKLSGNLSLAERKVVLKNLNNLMLQAHSQQDTSSTPPAITTINSSDIKAGDLVAIYLNNPSDANAGVIKPAKLEVLK